ncbi:hypothetical protein EYZ11_001127 [Aspergillus tanneri]|uniref:F-box domain-containing protein n=1 Tax=Aspergillus tanneri TaxID=1220188 RepID=A0A4S3JVI6_9EURO|nr:uncharacterized protein ATNIH1004_004419 [Aspergillus tanneri]KAA8648534.1 hypothetical protein ATNIH1004_004419 [Aspergillus tanneri]THC99403.1 hypothetical protein EYZ11_001127 [Aspergillus tanneri]
MLSRLPPEIVYHIATYLPSASALARLAQTCRRLHEVIAAEDWRIYRAFVKSRFPDIKTPLFWKDAAQALTSRSRALDRHAVIGRFVLQSQNAVKVGSHRATRRDNPTHGYRPAIDSYEVWNGDRWEDRREVLAWGAADELALRIKQTGANQDERWFVFNDLDHISSHDDICGVHILKPGHYAREAGKEHLIFGRLRGELVHLAISPDEETHEYKQQFSTFGLEIERIDLSDGPEPILAAHFNNGSIAFYNTTTGETNVDAFARLRIDPENVTRNKYSRFLSPYRFAVGTGRPDDALAISTITPNCLSLDREISVNSLDLEAQVGLTPNTSVSAIAPLNAQFSRGSSGDAFLAAWGDRVIRLHDLRSDKPYEAMYRDVTDQNPIYCVHPFANDRFFVGAGGDAVVKIFDLRMPKTYSYLETRLASLLPPHNHHMQSPNSKITSCTNGTFNSITYPRKDLTIFLSYQPPALSNSSRARARSSRSNRAYRGAVYTMSSPSALSPTIYTGIADAVVQLDFASTDDLTGPCREWYQNTLDIDSFDLNADSSSSPNQILGLSGYERPDPRNPTQFSKLRVQQPFSSVGEDDILNEKFTSWDRRWKRLEETGAWRRRG